MYDWAEFRHFRYLLAILERRGLRAAAEELHTSQPNLSVQARQFQDNAGVRLFKKTKRGHIRPTESGDAFIGLARHLLDVRNEVIDAIVAIERGEIASICSASSSLVDQDLFRELCSMQKRLVPSAELRPTHGDVPQLIKEVQTGDVDVALVTLPLAHPDIHVEELRRDRLVVCVRKDSPLANKAALVVGDLKDHLRIFYHPQKHPDAHDRLLELLTSVGVHIREFSRASHPYEMQALVRAGFGVALVREGRAGSGKTTVLASIREGAEKSGYIVEGFAPTSRASAQLRAVGIDATTLQSFLARGDNHPSASPKLRHLYMLDESSLASTRQMRAFLDKLNPNDRVVVIGDTSQHQGVDAGKPFEQMQKAGMRTSLLDHIMRQKDPELLKAVEELAKNNTQQGIDMLASQGRITEITDRQERIAAIARDYAAQPENTIVVSPDNRSRQHINEAVRAELLYKGVLAADGQTFRTLTHRSDMTGADRTWAARYNAGDVLQYTIGSKTEGIERDSFATVRAVDARANTVTVELANGSSLTYDPRRLRGVQVFSETERDFATGDRIQMTSTNRNLGVANRDLGTITGIENGQMSVRMDAKADRTITFDSAKFRQFDHGYAVTSHSSQGLTAGRVLAHFDTDGAHSLINTRLAYVAISRASDDARVYTNNADTLGQRLATDISKTAAVDFRPSSSTTEVQQAVAAFRASDPGTGTAKLLEQGRVHEYANPEHRLAAVALAYTAQEDRAVVVAPDAGERWELTQLIRDELRQQGRLAEESRAVPVLVEQHFGNPRLAANYAPGNEIHYKVGSPAQHGIADNSTAAVLSVDARANTLTIVTSDGNETSYNPALLKKQTEQSTVYREKQLDLAVGERITFTTSDRDAHIRSGDFAMVERVGENNALSVRHDFGKSVELSADQARYIDYGYAVENAQKAKGERVLITVDTAQLAQGQHALTRLSATIRDLEIYTSDSQGLRLNKSIADSDIAVSLDQLGRTVNGVSRLTTPDISLEEFGIGR